MATPSVDPIRELRQAPITRTLGDAALADLARASVVRQLNRGQMLFGEGEPSQWFHLVCDGRLRVLRISGEGNELVLSVVGPGGAIGELSVFDGEARSATVEAIEPSVVLAVPNSRLREALMASPPSLMAVVAELAATVRRLTGSASDLVFLDLPHRIARFLLQNAIDQGDGTGHVDLAMSQSGIAAQLGVSRQSYNTALNGLAHDNLIRVDGRRIVIPDLGSLRDFLDG
jgi:CRP/FNR family cyclic AMP-dependent transcriptional regulator